MFFTACCDKGIVGPNYKMVDGVIVTDEPARPEGAKSMLAFAADPIPVVRVGFVGLGMRGPAAVKRFHHIEGVEIKALCDKYEDRAAKMGSWLDENGRSGYTLYSGENGYKELCERDDIDLVYIATNWQTHVPIALYAMEHGKHVAIEVPAASTLEECWALVNTSERTGKHCMMLENCVYDFFELTTLNMAQQGVLGEILHTEGAYIHNLEPFWDNYADNWRLDFNQQNSGDVYPTHGFGPCCWALDIHRGDRLKNLSAMTTKSVNGLRLAKDKMGLGDFANGDHTTTSITTEKGKTILVEHNVLTPRPYNRMYQLTGSEGFVNKYPIQGITLVEGKVDPALHGNKPLDGHRFLPTEYMNNVLEAYKHPIHQEIEEKAKKIGGHGGMDFVMDYRLVYCLQNGLPLDQDVYDMAEWCCLTELSAISIAHNGASVAVPDFTRGEWNKLDGLKFYYKK